MTGAGPQSKTLPQFEAEGGLQCRLLQLLVEVSVLSVAASVFVNSRPTCLAQSGWGKGRRSLLALVVAVVLNPDVVVVVGIVVVAADELDLVVEMVVMSVMLPPLVGPCGRGMGPVGSLLESEPPARVICVWPS